jgi:anti-anti-sigma regulatory factor
VTEAHAQTYLITSGTYLVSCSGGLANSSSRRLAGLLGRLVDKDAREIVLELRDLRRIDRSTIEDLAEAARKATRAGAVATVACGDERVIRLLRRLGPDAPLRVEPSVPDAFAKVARRASERADRSRPR